MGLSEEHFPRIHEDQGTITSKTHTNIHGHTHKDTHGHTQRENERGRNGLIYTCTHTHIQIYKYACVNIHKNAHTHRETACAHSHFEYACAVSMVL